MDPKIFHNNLTITAHLLMIFLQRELLFKYLLIAYKKFDIGVESSA